MSEQRKSISHREYSRIVDYCREHESELAGLKIGEVTKLCQIIVPKRILAESTVVDVRDHIGANWSKRSGNVEAREYIDVDARNAIQLVVSALRAVNIRESLSDDLLVAISDIT